MDSLSGRARKLKDKIKKLGLENLFWLFSALKGSKKDPLLYLALISVVLLAVLASIAPTFISYANLPVSIQNSQYGEPFVGSEAKVQESPELTLIQQNSLAAVCPPIMTTPQVLGALAGGQSYEWTQKEVSEYVVQPGDNLWSIAEQFNVSLDTVLWANDLNKYTLIQIGQKLIIPPVSGVIHHVRTGDTLSQIAKTYKSEADKIVAFNNLMTQDDIYIGDILIVPDGVMPPPVVYAPQLVPLASSYFICPIGPPCRITQGLHWYNAIDFSHGKCGEPIYAAAGGTVLKVKLTSSVSKWAFSGAGNHLTILHPNGVVTMYGHIQTSFVNPGDQVYQGQIIALMGGAPGTPGAGSSTGCHLHFGVSGARNPFAN